jgi:hypothetical protein
MSKTSTDLALRVMQELGVVAAGETPSAEDSTLIVSEYYLAQQELEQRNIGAWDVEAIPEAYFVPLAKFMAARVAVMFGAPAADEEMALRTLRRVTAKPYIGNPEEVTYW